MQRYGTYERGYVAGPDTLGKVLGLLGIAAIFTAAGALIGPSLGRGGLLIGFIGSLACAFILPAVRERTPLNYILLFGFGLLEGILLGQILESYLNAGLGVLVLDAALATGLVTLIAGGIGYTTKRDLTGMGGILFIGLIALIVASVVGIFIHLAIFQIAISAIGAVLFSAYLVFDLNRIANSPQATAGDAIVLALSVYLDIVNLFLFLLRLLGVLRGNN